VFGGGSLATRNASGSRGAAGICRAFVKTNIRVRLDGELASPEVLDFL
jgi:hypothetical protein